MGEVYTELAFAHPFYDGNGRSLNFVVHEMCHREGFSLAWSKMDPTDYLKSLTLAINLKDYATMQAFLDAHVAPLPPPADQADDLSSIR